MAGGFNNKILCVNLPNRQIRGEYFFRTYFGGWVLIAYYPLRELEPGADPWTLATCSSSPPAW